jgi:hypothetical protein
MRYPFVVTALAVAGTATGLLAFGQQRSGVRETVLLDLPGVHLAEAVTSPNGNFVYYGDGKALQVFDRTRKRTTRLLSRNGFYLAMSRRGDLLALASEDDVGKGTHVYVLPLDPTTGLASGDLRRVSLEDGDTPAISPDGQSIAFADYGGTKPDRQRLATVATGGGPEHVLSASPQCTASDPKGDGMGPIAWAPDGKTIYFGLWRKKLTFRVPAAGGTATCLPFLSGRDPYPGPSPDGRLVVTGGQENVIFDMSGRRLGAFPANDRDYMFGWSGPTTILATRTLAKDPPHFALVELDISALLKSPPQ